MTSTTTYLVNGMTCGHCVAAVTEELSTLEGVREVVVELAPEGSSAVQVTSDEPLVDEQVRDAVDEAGYELAGTA